MKVKVEDAGACRRILHIEVPRESVASEYKTVIAAYAKSARIPGFRPGRAPAAVIEGHFAKDALQDTRERLVSRFYHEALKEQNIQPVVVLNVRDDNLAKDQDFFFDIVIDVAPDFALPPYKGIELQGHSAAVTEKDVEDAVQGLRNRMARFEDVTGRGVRKDDLIQIDYAGTCDNKPVSEIAGEAVELGEGKDFWMIVGDTEILPGLSLGLDAQTVGERRQIAIAFPADYRVNAVSGKKAVYDVTVKAIREKKLPDVDASFLKALEVDSEETLRKRLRDDLARYAEAEEKRRIKNEIVKTLLKTTQLNDLPQSLVDEEAKHIVEDIVYENAVRGATREQIEERKDDILSAATQSSTERVKISQILARIAEKESVVVVPVEVDRQIEIMATRHKTSPAKMRAELEKRNGLEEIESQIRANKVLDLLLAHAKIIQVPDISKEATGVPA